MNRYYNGLQIIGLDFETYYDNDYTLKKMDTPLYVTDERYQLWGVGIDDKYYDNEDDAFNALMGIDWSSVALMCHNAAFDGYILNYHYGINPQYYIDTLSMARPFYKNKTGLGLDQLAKYIGFQGKTSDILKRIKGIRDLSPEQSKECGDYCLQDISEMWLLFEHLIPMLNDMEMDLIDLTISMFAQPKFHADEQKLESEIDRILRHKESVFQGVSHLLPQTLNATTGDEIKTVLRSPKQFAQSLEHNNIKIPMKVSPTTGKDTYAFAKTDLDFTALSNKPGSAGDLLRRARLEAKSETEITKVQKLIKYYQQGGAVPAYLNYALAQTLRWTGKELQMQNMNRGGEMRKSLIAPDGYVIGVVDSGQIEARCLAWLADEVELLETIRLHDQDPENHQDPYCKMASKVYGFHVTKANKDERFIGKIAVLGLGYGMSAKKFQITLAQGVMGPPVDVPLEICERTVQIYRQDNKRIVSLWNMASRWLSAISRNGKMPLSYKGMSFEQGRIYTHEGMYLNYEGLYYDPNDNSFKYPTQKGDKYIYGALLCIDGETEVLTDSGWKRLKNIQLNDLVHDGVEFVKHGGLLFKGVQHCISIDNVYMTPEHEVLTNEGWKAASQNPEPYRPNIRNVNYIRTRKYGQKETQVDMQMSVWNNLRENNKGYKEIPKSKLRMLYEKITRKTENTWNVKTYSLWNMEKYERQVQLTFTSGVEKLRRAWNNGMQQMEQQFRTVLGGYGKHISTGINTGTSEQYARVYENKLSVENNSRPKQQSQNKHYNTNPKRKNDRSKCLSGIQYKTNYAPLPDKKLSTIKMVQPTRQEKTKSRTCKVYDIIDCGPRKRFVVKGKKGPFIVHNCENIIQHISRNIIAFQMLMVSKRYKVLLTVHDEVVVLIPENEADKGMEFLYKCFTTAPKWCPDIPLSADGGYDYRYSK